MKKTYIVSFFAVALGGAVGTFFRYLITLKTVNFLFPLGTLLVNFGGSLLLGFLTGWLVHRRINESLKTGLGVGLCGGFTTMSTLTADFHILASGSNYLFAVTYLGSSIIGGVSLAFLGYFGGVKLSLKSNKAGVSE